jgi:hypothetical protein
MTTTGGTGGSGTAGGNGGNGGTGGTGPNITIKYTKTNLKTLQNNMIANTTQSPGGGGGGSGGAGSGGNGGQNELFQDQPTTYAPGGAAGPNTAVSGSGGASGASGSVAWVELTV